MAAALAFALGFSSCAFAQEPNFFGWSFGQQPVPARNDQPQGDPSCVNDVPPNQAYINGCGELIVPTDDPVIGAGKG
jgi:hypothetical protein